MEAADPTTNDRKQVQSSRSDERIAVVRLAREQLNARLSRVRCGPVHQPDKLSDLFVFNMAAVIAIVVSAESAESSGPAVGTALWEALT